MSKVVMKFVGRDSWERPIYTNNGRYYVDVDPTSRHPASLCTKYRNAFDGEPDIPYHAKPGSEIVFCPQRDTWD